MNLTIRPIDDGDVEDVVQLSLLAWAPVFRSLRQVLGPEIYAAIWPDWRAIQREGVDKACRQGEPFHTWVAEVAGSVVGFLTCKVHDEDKIGEVYYLAVHPAHQNRGIGTALNAFALEKMRAWGMEMARVETGGDPGHAPARRCYEKAGYTGLPLVRYFKKL